MSSMSSPEMPSKEPSDGATNAEDRSQDASNPLSTDFTAAAPEKIGDLDGETVIVEGTAELANVEFTHMDIDVDASRGSRGRAALAGLKHLQDQETYQKHHWEGTFAEYLDLVERSPEVTRNAYQRVYDMIMSYGVDETANQGEVSRHYRFFDDPRDPDATPDAEHPDRLIGRDAIFGMDESLDELVSAFHSAAMGYGIQKRVLLLHGPVGSSKSTIARLLKKGLERYSRSDEGALYELGFKDPENSEVIRWSPMHEEPLNAIPERYRKNFLDNLNQDREEGEFMAQALKTLSPPMRYYFREWMEKKGGDLEQVLGEIMVRRVLISEEDRIGIGTFQPKDEKNQDSTELTGDLNYRQLAEYGSDSDPRAFNFDGEFMVANRGIVEFVEVLKLDVAFLYDLLGASQEHKVKPKKFPQTDIDEVILGHTNEPEYRRLQNNEFMEALRDRTVKIDVPYVTRLRDEIKIYEKDFNAAKVKGKHIAPHTIEMAAMWAVLTRLEEPKNASLSRLQKLKLYNGKTLPGFTKENIRELREDATREGFSGISPRYVQDKISNALAARPHAKSINPFMVLNELEAGLKHHSLITSDDLRKQYADLLAEVKSEYENIVKKEVQRAIAADEDALKRLCANYIDNVKAYTQREKVKNKFTGQAEEPDERLMRSIEEKIDIPDSRKDDFRREIMNYIGALAIDGKKFDFKTNERLSRALELKLFEDQKDTIKLTSLVSQVVDQETQAKIDVVKTRLIETFGYDDESATDVLHYVASIFARGDAKG